MADVLSLEHPDVPWSLPPNLPTAAALERAIDVLTVPPTGLQHAIWCLGKLTLAFENTRLDKDTAKARAGVWLETNADLGNNLWSEATLSLCQNWRRDEHYGRAPEPADFRAVVARKLRDREEKLHRCRQMLQALTGEEQKTTGPRVFKEEPLADRLRTLINGLKRIGKVDRAAGYERELAKVEERPVERWACEESAPSGMVEKINTPALPPPSRTMQARTLRSSAEFHRREGRDAIADKIEAEARQLAPEIFEPAAVQEAR